MQSATFYRNILLVIGAIVAVTGVAFASSYFTKQSLQTSAATVKSKPVATQKTVRYQQTASAQPARCNDGNVLGYVAGGAAGGIIGNQIGGGSGKTAATIGGTLGGAYLGGQYIPLEGATCRH